MSILRERYASSVNSSNLSVKAETTRKPCKKCGGSVRYKNRDCKQCADIRSAAYNEKNRLEIKAMKKAYTDLNKESIKEKKAAYYKENAKKISEIGKEKYPSIRDRKIEVNAKWVKENPEKVRAMKERWAEKNPEVRRVITHNYRARKRENGGKLSIDIAKTLLSLQKGKCACCAANLGSKYHLDHKMPLFLGGPNVDENMQLLCVACNCSKGAKHPVDFMQSKGFLV